MRAAIHAATPDVPSIAAFAARHPLAGQTAAERTQINARLARRIVMLDYWQQRALSESPEMHRFYREFTSAEKERFLHLTIPSAMRNVFRAVAATPRAEREAFLNRAFYEVETTIAKDTGAGVNERRVEGWVQDAAREAFFNTPLGLRMELQPIIVRNLPGYFKPL